MRLTVIGTGYVGLVSGTCFADLGHDVTCVDSDAEKIAALTVGRSPIFEPGLEELIAANMAHGRLRFTTDLASAVAQAQASFIAVGTPASEHDGQPDLAQLTAAMAAVARAAAPDGLIVIKSTVPVGTLRRLHAQCAEFRPGQGLQLASNPEFLRQGSAVEDFLHPERIVVGVAGACAKEKMAELYAPLVQQGIPLVTTTFESAEMIKYAANTMLAAKIAFINEIADICERTGANVRDVALGVGLDSRIGGQFLQAGPGFGGSCFPKDTMALQGIAQSHRLITPLVDAVVASNLQRKQRMIEKIVAACGGSVAGKTLAVLGLTFKPGTDDLRESISLAVIPAMLAMGAHIRAYDPQGMKNAASQLKGDIAWCRDAYDAAAGAHACVLLTEWNEFRTLDLPRLASTLAVPLMIDLRNIYRRRRMVAAGLRYVSIGRAEVSPESPHAIDLVPEDEAA